MAQLVEQLIRNQQVAGSSPATSSKNSAHIGVRNFYFFTLHFSLLTSPLIEDNSEEATEGKSFRIFYLFYTALLTNRQKSAIIKLLRFSSF